MKNVSKIFYCFVLIILTLLLITSCTPSVPKVDYDKVATDLSSAQSQSQTLSSQLSDTQNQNKDLEDQLSSMKTQNQDLQDKLIVMQNQTQSLKDKIASAESNIESMQSQNKVLHSNILTMKDKINKLKLITDTINAVFQPMMSGETLSDADGMAIFTQMTGNIALIGDAQLSNKYDAMLNSFANNSAQSVQDTASYDFYEYIFDLQSTTMDELATEIQYY